MARLYFTAIDLVLRNGEFSSQLEKTLAAFVSAARAAAEKVKAGELQPEDITEELFESLTYTADSPPLDLVLRPSGEQRISNFLLWQCAYSEFVYMDTLWPDFTPKDLDLAIEEFGRRSRRFGGR